MQIHNMMTCENMIGTELIGPCSMAWLGAAILFFIIVFVRKGLESFDIEFNSLYSFVIGYVAYVVAVTVGGAAKWGILAGIVGMLIGGIGMGYFMPDSGGGSYG